MILPHVQWVSISAELHRPLPCDAFLILINRAVRPKKHQIYFFLNLSMAISEEGKIGGRELRLKYVSPGTEV
jgi:hypothetical protein